MNNPLKKFFKSKLKLAKGTRFVSFLFIGSSILIAAGFLFAANMYYNIDTGEIVMEEIQRVTQTIRATAGMIIAGNAASSTPTGVTLEVATGTVSLSAADQVLRFTGGTSPLYYTGFRATTTMTTTTVYYLPPRYADAADYVLTWQAGNQLTWKTATSTGAGDITAVGDVASGPAFTGSDTGNTLYFEGSVADTNEIALTAANPSADATITLPALTGTVTLTSGSLTEGGVLFAVGGLITQDAANLYWATSTGRLGIGTNAPNFPLDVAGAIRGTQLRINGAGAGDVVFNAPSTSTDTTYTWPTGVGSSNYVLTTDGTGGLSWTSVTGVGAVTGSGEANRLARWTSATNLATSSIVDNYSGTALTIDAAGTTTIANNLIVSGAGGITSALYTSTATTTFRSAAGNDIILDPGSGKITLTAGDYIQTASGYAIGQQNTEILREMIPILGFDLPAQTATTSYVKISRTIQNYPFSPAATGTTRIHKLVIRYTDSLPLASSTNWKVATTTTGSGYSTFTLNGCNQSTSTLDSGRATTTSVTIPTSTTPWWLEVQSQAPYPNNVLKVFEIFLAAYDRIQ